MAENHALHTIARQAPLGRLVHKKVVRPLRQVLQVEVEVVRLGQVVEVDRVELEHVVGREAAYRRHRPPPLAAEAQKRSHSGGQAQANLSTCSRVTLTVGTLVYSVQLTDSSQSKN